jgi:hypothetical protein
MIFTLARAEEFGIGAEIWRQPQRLTRLQPPISAVSFVGANATLSARLEECLSIVRANGREQSTPLFCITLSINSCRRSTSFSHEGVEVSIRHLPSSLVGLNYLIIFNMMMPGGD